MLLLLVKVAGVLFIKTMNPNYNKHLSIVILLFTVVAFILICCTNNKKEEETTPVIVTDSVSTYNPIYDDSVIITIENDYDGVDQ